MDKIKELAWHWQLLLLISVAALSYAGFYYFVTSGIRAETQTISAEVVKLKSENQLADFATQNIETLRTLFANKQEEYDELKVLLPEQREITNVLQGLQDTARGSALIVNRFSPRADAQEDFITAKPVEVEVDSNFNNLRDFFDKMAKLPRIVSVTDFNLTQLDKQSANKTLHARFLLTAYYASKENLGDGVKKNPDGTPAAPAAGGAPPTVPAAAQPTTLTN